MDVIETALDELVKSAAHLVLLDGVSRGDGFDRRLGEMVSLLPASLNDEPAVLDAAYALAYAYASDAVLFGFHAGSVRRGPALLPIGPMILLDIEAWVRSRLAAGAGWRAEWCPFAGPAARAWARAFGLADFGQVDPAMGVRTTDGEVVRVTVPRLASPAPGPGDEGDEGEVFGPCAVAIWPGNRLLYI